MSVSVCRFSLAPRSFCIWIRTQEISTTRVRLVRPLDCVEPGAALLFPLGVCPLRQPLCLTGCAASGAPGDTRGSPSLCGWPCAPCDGPVGLVREAPFLAEQSPVVPCTPGQLRRASGLCQHLADAGALPPDPHFLVGLHSGRADTLPSAFTRGGTPWKRDLPRCRGQEEGPELALPLIRPVSQGFGGVPP